MTSHNINEFKATIEKSNQAKTLLNPGSICLLVRLRNDMKKKFCLIGNGKMGSAFVNLIHKDFQMTVASPNTSPSYPCVFANDISEIDECFDYITFAVKPMVLPQVLRNIRKTHYHEETRFISLIAGAQSEVFRSSLGEQIKLSQIMTNLPVKIGKGIVAVYSDEKLNFLEKLGQVIYVPKEDDLNRFCAAVGSGSGFCYSIFEMYEEAVRKMGLGTEVDTRRLVLNLFQGSIDLLEESGLSFAEQKANVVTPNGTTHAGLQELTKSGSFVDAALDKALHRSRELGVLVSEELKKQK